MSKPNFCVTGDEFHYGHARSAFPGILCLGRLGFLTLLFAVSGFALQTGISQLVRASISSVEADWKAEPHFSYIERDVNEKGDVTSSKTYRVCMIDGSPYFRLVAVGGEPLPPAEQVQEGEKLREESR